MSPLSTEHQIGGLAALGYVEDLVKNDPELYDAPVVAEVERRGEEFDKRRIAAGAKE